MMEMFLFAMTFDVNLFLDLARSRRGRDRMVVGFISTYAISAYHH